MSLFANLGPSTVRFVSYSINSFFLHNTDEDVIIKACQLLKPKLSSCYDQLCTKTMCSIINLISHPLAYPLNLSFSNGIFPNCFKIVNAVYPYIKEAIRPNLIINLSTISIHPSLSKVLKRIMCNRIVFINWFPVKFAFLWV